MASIGPAPPGGDVNRGTSLVVVTWVFTSIALVAVAARLFGRFKLAHNAGRDDLIIVIAMFLGTIYTAVCTAAAAAGQGRHPYYLGLAQTSLAIELNSIALIPGVLAFSVPKLAVACLLMRLLNPSKRQRWILYTLTISCIIFSALCALFLFIQCSPVTALWNPQVAATATCWDPSVLIDYSMFVGAYSAFVDGYLAIYPVAVLRSLNINTKKKVGLCFVMGLGITAACIAIYKCTRLPELSQHTDYTFATTDLLIWTSVESNVIIIAACLPTLRPIFLLLIGRSDSSKGTSNQMARKSYQLSSLTKRSTKGGRQQYPLTTTDFEKVESAERILPPSRIRQTFDVSVVYDQKKDLPKWDNGFANVNNSCEHYVEGENAGTTKSRAMVTSGEV